MKKVAFVLALVGILGSFAAAQPQVNQMNNLVWVANQGSGSLVAYETSGAQTTISMSVPNSPTGIAVSPDGHVYVAQAGMNKVFHSNANGSVVASYTVGSNPSSIAFDSDGYLWVMDSGAPSFYKMSGNGTVMLTITPNVSTLYFQGGIAANRFNQVWAANTNDSKVYVYDYVGVAYTFSPISVSTLYSNPIGVAVDRQGHCWVAFQNGGGIFKFDRNSGSILASIVTGNPSPVSIAVNNFNEVYVTNSNAGTGTLNYYSQNGVLILSATVGEAISGISLDGNGDVWVTGIQNNRIYKYDRWSLNRLGYFSTSTNPLNLGDFTGYVQANIFNQGSTNDLDGDTYDNASEVDAGTNPFDLYSTPLNPRPVQSGLPSVGSTFWTAFRFYDDATLGFAAAASLNATANPNNYIQVPNTSLSIPLESDGLYYFSFRNFWIFREYGGFLDANGDAYGRIHLPSSYTPAVGVTFYVAFITLDNQNKGMPITTISNNLPITVMP